MRTVIKLGLIFIALFSTMFALNLVFGWITADNVQQLLTWLRNTGEARLWIALAILGVLSIDSILAVPTITTIILAGFFLGPLTGGLVAGTGLLLAGQICYWGGRSGGEGFLRLIRGEKAELTGWFARSGSLALLLSRSLPMLPEVLSVLAGISRMNPARYLALFFLGNVPFAFLAAYAGSRSDLDRPWPALLVGLGVPAIGWIFYWNRRKHEAGVSKQKSTIEETESKRRQQSGTVT